MSRISIFFILISIKLCAFDLALDVGHTPLKSGAISSQCLNEYQYNRSLVSYIASELPKESSRIKIFRENNQEVSFAQRYILSEHKDLFLSIHHDSVQKKYIKNNKASCPVSDHAAGYSIFISRKNPYFNESLVYAKTFGAALVKQGLKPSLHHAEPIAGENRELLDSHLGIYIFDDLKVLKNSRSPAILFEAGVLVNPEDEKLVQSESYKYAIVKAMKAVID